MCELDTQLSLLTGASSALQQQLGEQQDAAAATAAARQVREDRGRTKGGGVGWGWTGCYGFV